MSAGSVILLAESFEILMKRVVSYSLLHVADDSVSLTRTSVRRRFSLTEDLESSEIRREKPK